MVEVEGMMCQKSCGSTVQAALEAVPGVANADVSFLEGIARVWCDPGAATNRPGPVETVALVEAVEDVGFAARAIPPLASLRVEGMMCQKSCGSTVKAALLAVAGVTEAEVSFPEGLAWVWSRVPRGAQNYPPAPGAAFLVDAVETVGFGAEVVAAPGHRKGDTVSQVGASERDSSGTGEGIPGGGRTVLGVERGHERGRGKRGGEGQRRESGTPMGELRLRLGQGQGQGQGARVMRPGVCSGVFTVGGMSCMACVSNVERRVKGLRGVEEVKVTLLTGQAVVHFDPSLTSAKAVSDLINSAGYTTTVALTTVSTSAGRGGGGGGQQRVLEVAVSGMSCSSCSGKVERALRATKGVESCSVSVVMGRAKVVLNPLAKVGVTTEVVDAITRLGFGAKVLDMESEACEGVGHLEKMTREEVIAWRRLFVVSVVLTIPILTLNWLQVLEVWDGGQVMGSVKLSDTLMFFLATPVQFVIGRRFYYAAWKGLAYWSLGMDALVVIGTTSAYTFSVAVLVIKAIVNPAFPGRCMFETAAMLFTLVTMGKLMEAIAKGKTSKSITALAKLQPRTALRLAPGSDTSGVLAVSTVSAGGGDVERAGGEGGAHAEAQEIDACLVEVGDLLLVVPGSSIPVDGRVVSGNSSVNESMVRKERRKDMM
ncbi:unnamed protein product [Discosporangium mesarthrocarpum]